MENLTKKLEGRFIYIAISTLTAFLVVTTVTLSLSQRYAGIESQRSQAYARIEALDRLFLAFDDAETGQRGFLLTGNTAYLQPFFEARERVDAALGEFNNLFVGHDDGAVQRLALLKTQKFDELDETIELRREQRLQAALAMINAGHGKAYMDEIRELVAVKKAEQKALVSTLQKQTAAAVKQYHYSAIIFILILLLTLLALVSLVRNDLAAKKDILDRLQHEANHDPLTHLPNRKLFVSILNFGTLLAGRENRMLGVMFVDLDGFKAVNDTQGHAAGDAVLTAAAQTLKACLRGSDVVARVGGDEFVIMVNNLQSQADAEHIATHILDRFSFPLSAKQGEIKVGASIGIALFPRDGTRSEDLIRTADAAMYRAKETGKNRFVFSSDLELVP